MFKEAFCNLHRLWFVIRANENARQRPKTLTWH